MSYTNSNFKLYKGLENLLEATAKLLDETDQFLLYSSDMEQEVYYDFNEGMNVHLE